MNAMSREQFMGNALAVERSGEGSPTFIFVHGFACDRHDWAAQKAALSRRFSVVTLDLPGFGESEAPQSASASAETLARVVCEVVARHGGGQAILVGHSLGSRVILEAFRRSPGGIVGLVLVDGHIVAEDVAKAGVQAFKVQLDAMGFYNFLAASFSAMFDPDGDPHVREQVLSRMARVKREFAEPLLIESVQNWHAATAAQVLAGIDVPCLMLQSTEIDASFRFKRLEAGCGTPWTDLVTRKVPQAELRIIPNAGHFVQIEAAELVNEHLLAFGSRIRGAHLPALSPRFA